MKNNTPVFIMLTPGFPANDGDTTCLPFLQNLIKSINKNFSFIKIIILTFQYPFTASEYTWNGIEVISFAGKNRSKLARLLLWKKVWHKLRLIQRENKIIGLFSIWLGECALLGKRFGKKYNIVHKCWMVGQDAKAHNKYVKRIKPLANDLIAISDFIAGEFFKNYLIYARYVITNGIDKSLFKNDSFERHTDVIGVGSLIPLKQYDMFIDIIAELKKTIPEITSVIAGKGPEEKLLKEKIEHFGATKNIFLPGEITYADVLNLMQQSKIFLHTSRYEGFSMVCLEALYAGCHVISFCKPMNVDFKHWYIVTTKEEMIEKVHEILMNANIVYERLCPYSIEDSSALIVKLFGY